MIITWFRNLPLHIDPIAFSIGTFSIRWYALLYLAGLGVIYGLLRLRIERGEYLESQKSKVPAIGWSAFGGKSQNEISNLKSQISNLILDFLLVAFFSALIGARLGYVMLYNLPYFMAHPMEIISPYNFGSGEFIGIFGMSYHGGLIGILIGSYIFLEIKKIDFLEWADFVIPAVPLGYFLGRIGNFLNGELYGRITNSPLGMYFSQYPTVLRWPSQLMEAFLEGLVLFTILWAIRKKEMPKGSLLAIYLIGYGFFRILGEIFREPDPQLGLFFGYFSLGQILSLIMIIVGAGLLLKKRKM